MIVSGQVRFYDALQPFMVDIDTVQPHPENYNNGDVDEIEKSILTNGMYQILKVDDATSYLLAGNSTWEACKRLHSEIIPVIRLDPDDPTTALRIMVTDNETARLAIPDPPHLTSLLQQIYDRSQHQLEGTGRTHRDLTALHALAQMQLHYDPATQWPTLTFRIPPALHTAYTKITNQTVTNLEAFELLLRLAGWDGT